MPHKGVRFPERLNHSGSTWVQGDACQAVEGMGQGLAHTLQSVEDANGRQDMGGVSVHWRPRVLRRPCSRTWATNVWSSSCTACPATSRLRNSLSILWSKPRSVSSRLPPLRQWGVKLIHLAHQWPRAPGRGLVGWRHSYHDQSRSLMIRYRFLLIFSCSPCIFVYSTHCYLFLNDASTCPDGASAAVYAGSQSLYAGDDGGRPGQARPAGQDGQPRDMCAHSPLRGLRRRSVPIPGGGYPDRDGPDQAAP
jgi:hypothetical protein